MKTPTKVLLGIVAGGIALYALSRNAQASDSQDSGSLGGTDSNTPNTPTFSFSLTPNADVPFNQIPQTPVVPDVPTVPVSNNAKAVYSYDPNVSQADVKNSLGQTAVLEQIAPLATDLGIVGSNIGISILSEKTGSLSEKLINKKLTELEKPTVKTTADITEKSALKDVATLSEKTTQKVAMSAVEKSGIKTTEITPQNCSYCIKIHRSYREHSRRYGD